MTKVQVFILAGAALVITLVGCSGEAEPAEPTPMVDDPFGSMIAVTGKVVPAEWAVLSIQTDGVVEEVLVERGDEVEAGDLLVRLDTVDAELDVREAEAQLATARADLERLRSGPRAIDVAAAKQQVDVAAVGILQAESERDRIASGAIWADIAEAEANLEAAEAEWRAARIEYDELQAELKDGTAEDWEGERAALRLRAARESLDATELALAYARVGSSARTEEADAGVRAAEAQRDVAEAELEQVMAGPSEEEIALAGTAVEQARIALEEARLRLERCKRQAPFAGTVGRVDVREGEQVRRGTPLVTLGDLSTLRVETTDLDEIDAAKIEVGQSVEVTFDAFPDRVFEGRVVRIDPMPQGDGGGVNYRTIIELAELAPEIRWGMTAFVDIEVGE